MDSESRVSTPMEQLQDSPEANPNSNPFENSASEPQPPEVSSASSPATSIRNRVSFPAGTPIAEPDSFMGHRRQASSASSNFRYNNDLRTGHSTPAAGIMTPGNYSLASSAHLRHRKAFQSRALEQDETPEKPWLLSVDRKKSDRKAYWLFVAAIMLGIAGFVGIVYSGYASVPNDKYCLVMQDDFNGDSIDKSIWFHEQETGGFGNNEFEWTTDSTNNSFVSKERERDLEVLTSFTHSLSLCFSLSLQSIFSPSSFYTFSPRSKMESSTSYLL